MLPDHVVLGRYLLLSIVRRDFPFGFITIGEVSQDGNSTLADEVGAALRPCGSHAHGCHMHGGDRGFSD